jgi:hypothetical protein
MENGKKNCVCLLLLHVQGPKSNIKAVGDYLGADGPLERKYIYIFIINFSPDPKL